MIYIVDKTILILLSAFLLFRETAGAHMVIALLVTVLIAALNSFSENRRYIWATVFLYGIGIMFLSELVWMVPVVFFDAFAYATVIPLFLLAVSCMICGGGMSVYSVLYLLFGVVLGYYMYRKSRKLELLEYSVKKVRDDEEERNILLTEKNRHLIEKQDQEVYVATLKERNRIAREIHDNVGHILTRTILQIGALMTIHKEEPLHEQLTSVKENLDVAMNNVRESVHDLHDESVDLNQAVTEIVDGMKGRFDYRVEYDIHDKVDRKYKYAMIGIIREGVSNILKHSRNTDVDIVLREHPGMYQIIVHDYDSVQETSTVHKAAQNDMFEKMSKSGGIGLQNIQDRVLGLNGHVDISTEHGFRIFVTLPRQQDMREEL